MGIYSAHGSAAFDRRVKVDLQRIVSRVCGDRGSRGIEAIVLVGSYGRGEGVALRSDGVETPFNDYDLIVVVRNRIHARTSGLRRRLDGLARALSRELRMAVDFHIESLSGLCRLAPTLFNVEARYGHRVLWGDRTVLERMPHYAIDRLPQVEGSRLLLNRGALLLHEKTGYRYFQHPEDGRNRTGKFVLKTHLALGDSLLIASSHFAVGYAAKRQRIAHLVGVDDAPERASIIDRYLRAIDLRESGDPRGLEELEQRSSIIEVRQILCRFFAWFEARRSLHTGERIDDVVPTKSVFARGNEPIRSAVRNTLLLRGGVVTAGWSWIRRPPRERLFACLPVLLSDQPEPGALLFASRLLGTVPSPESATRAFLSMWGQLS